MFEFQIKNKNTITTFSWVYLEKDYGYCKPNNGNYDWVFNNGLKLYHHEYLNKKYECSNLKLKKIDLK